MGWSERNVLSVKSVVAGAMYGPGAAQLGSLDACCAALENGLSHTSATAANACSATRGSPSLGWILNSSLRPDHTSAASVRAGLFIPRGSAHARGMRSI